MKLNDTLIPLWPYKHKDKKTWKYKDVLIFKSVSGKTVKKWILNDGFKYKKLDPHYPKEKNGK